MVAIAPIKTIKLMFLAAVAALLCLVAGCNRTQEAPGTVQGYVEGDFIYVAAPLPGKLATLFVQRGAQVKAGEPLFELETEKASTEVPAPAAGVLQIRVGEVDRWFPKEFKDD